MILSLQHEVRQKEQRNIHINKHGNTHTHTCMDTCTHMTGGSKSAGTQDKKQRNIFTDHKETHTHIHGHTHSLDRWFKILIRENSIGGKQLACSGFEIYGRYACVLYRRYASTFLNLNTVSCAHVK